MAMMETPKPSLSSSPQPCLDLTQVQGPVIEFGVEGDGVPSQSVMIAADGQLTAEGWINIRDNPLFPLTVKALVQLASSHGFWTMPEFTGEKRNPDVPYEFVTIQLSCTSRHVAVRGGDKTGPFAELYALLSDLVTLKQS